MKRNEISSRRKELCQCEYEEWMTEANLLSLDQVFGTVAQMEVIKTHKKVSFTRIILSAVGIPEMHPKIIGSNI